MPLLNCQFLKGYREQRLAHLVLSFITMGYVWQEGETQPGEVRDTGMTILSSGMFAGLEYTLLGIAARSWKMVPVLFFPVNIS